MQITGTRSVEIGEWFPHDLTIKQARRRSGDWRLYKCVYVCAYLTYVLTSRAVHTTTWRKHTSRAPLVKGKMHTHTSASAHSCLFIARRTWENPKGCVCRAWKKGISAFGGRNFVYCSMPRVIYMYIAIYAPRKYAPCAPPNYLIHALLYYIALERAMGIE